MSACCTDASSSARDPLSYIDGWPESLSGKPPGRVKDAAVGLRDGDLEIAGVRPKLHVALAGDSRARDARPQRLVELGDHAHGVARVTEDARGQVCHHRLEPAFIGEMEREQEFAVGHNGRFYSDRWPNSTRARAQSAAIWARKVSRDSKARSSRNRWTNPRRIVAPYRSRVAPKMCVSVCARPAESTVGRT